MFQRRVFCAFIVSTNVRLELSPRCIIPESFIGLTCNPISLKASEKMHPVGRIGEPKDITNAIQFLINPKNNWITGQTLSLDGGMSTTK